MKKLHSEDLVKSYRKRTVVNEVSVEVNQGEIVGLLGPNGAGKTTTFYMIIGFIKPENGRVILGDNNITGLPMYRRARLGIGYLAQEPSIFRKLTVWQNVMAVAETLPLSKKERTRKTTNVLEELDVLQLRKSKGYQLSGGERRRVEIARALVLDPDFMLLDEPFAGIDPIAVEDIQRIIASLREKGLGILMTDHNVRETLAIIQRAYIMCDGK
ncbi:MAG: LPS export ABC transporter ATP-binding protein, partial [candidate division Zixibacteria bacterium]|nr:LPS export ABC transporter ATP-binding protein [candidate division Zixibacteria bacterium]